MDFFLQIVSMAFSAFASATVLPGSSEAVLTVLISAYPQLWGVLLLTATVANTAGSLLTFAAGSFKLPLMPSAAALAVGKGLRYTVLVWAVLQTA